VRRVLVDNGTPRGVAAGLPSHIVEETRSRGWDGLRCGELLDRAEAAGFDVLLTTDLNVRFRQNLAGRRIAIVALDDGRWRLISSRLRHIGAAVTAATPGSFTEVDVSEEFRA